MQITVIFKPRSTQIMLEKNALILLSLISKNFSLSFLPLFRLRTLIDKCNNNFVRTKKFPFFYYVNA